MEKFFNPDKKIVIPVLGINLLLILIIIGMVFVSSNRVETMYSEMAAERWENDALAYSEVSLYYENISGLTESDIFNIRNSVQTKLAEDSFIDEGSENRAWIDSYSTQTTTTIRKDSTNLDVDVYLVGGDFFKIHPIPLKGGNYLDIENQDFNQIVLDENVAWNLFGSNNIEGMKVWIGESVYTIAGVVGVSEDKADIQAYGEHDCVYIPFKAYSKEDKELKATNYQAVIPNPIKNYAKNILAEAAGIHFKTDEELKNSRTILNFDDVELVENTDRYSIISLFGKRNNHKYVDMRVNTIQYPYWENVAKYNETQMLRWLNAAMILSIIPLLSLVYLMIWLYKRRRWALKPVRFVTGKISGAIEEKKIKKYEEKEKKKEEEELELRMKNSNPQVQQGSENINP
ncbi:MAG: ABC transporter permease [Eubacterium sp.]|nr:ABC transporter permease [Eubacterium sp.]